MEIDTNQRQISEFVQPDDEHPQSRPIASQQTSSLSHTQSESASSGHEQSSETFSHDAQSTEHDDSPGIHSKKSSEHPEERTFNNVDISSTIPVCYFVLILIKHDN